MKYILNSLFVLSISLPVAAAPQISYDGTTTQTLTQTSLKSAGLNKTSSKKVTLLKLKLSNDVKKAIQKNATHAMQTPLSNQKELPSSVQLGMNNVPVLDQGYHGTCATFAISAAMDALHGHDAYYSELCSLNLGKTLEENGYNGSGWNGQSIGGLLARIDEFGLVSKSAQLANGCGGVTEYPLQDIDTSEAMPLDAFHAISEPAYFSGLSAWSTIFDVSQWVSKSTSMDHVLERTKTSLYYGNRLTIGALLRIMDGQVGLLGTHHVKGDSLVLTPRLEQAIKLFILENDSDWGGHALIITGYDDNAIAIDNEGRQHKGLFTLRNSWGADAGDKGDIYMSYDYFKALAIEVVELIKISP